MRKKVRLFGDFTRKRIIGNAGAVKRDAREAFRVFVFHSRSGRVYYVLLLRYYYIYVIYELGGNGGGNEAKNDDGAAILRGEITVVFEIISRSKVSVRFPSYFRELPFGFRPSPRRTRV